jgi:hypothetical protein
MAESVAMRNDPLSAELSAAQTQIASVAPREAGVCRQLLPLLWKPLRPPLTLLVLKLGVAWL